MTREQIQDIVKEAIRIQQPDPARFYHLCWWQDGIQCLHVHHTTDSHPIFLTLPGEVLTHGLSVYQWQLLTGRIIYFCQMMDLSPDAPPVEAPAATPPAPGHRLPVTEPDWKRLTVLLADVRATLPRAEASFLRLRRLLVNADVMPSRNIPPEVVTMNSRVRLQHEGDDRESVVTLVFPPDARGSDFEKVKLSVLTQTGMALLGRKVGDTIMDCLAIAELLYQPEAAGDFDL